MNQIMKLEPAIKYLESILFENGEERIISTELTNNHHHAILTLKDGVKIYLMYKDKPFMEYLNYYPELQKIKDIICCVDSMNTKVFKKVMDDKKIRRKNERNKI